MWTPPPGAEAHRRRAPTAALAALIAIAILAPCAARTGDAPPRELPPACDVSGTRVILNGSAVRTVWGFEIYRIGLFLTAANHDADSILQSDRNPKRVHIIMLRGVSSDQFTGTVQESIDRNFTPEEKTAFGEQLSTFLGFFHGGADLRAGSEVVLDFVPGRGMVATLDGRELGSIAGPDFYHAILRLWLSKPLQSSIRDGLLGGARG
jgi:hypothetical protein